MSNKIEVLGAREHNLQNIDVEIPRNQLVVFTGLSGSGKSSLAFDTIYAEGQRRYMETFSAYARHFIGNMERPDVDYIGGLSPVISIEQKTTNKNPRSTVGTLTEIYDFVRLLYARIGVAYSHVSGKKMVKYTESQILETIAKAFSDKEVTVLAPLVKRRKGHYRELFVQVAKKGFLRVRVDGEICEITYKMQVDRYKTHDIELVVDRMRVGEKNADRLKEAVQMAFKQGKGVLMILDDETGQTRYFSRTLMDPDTGISYPDPEPNTFSFNSPYGACPHCNGIGEVSEIDLAKLIPNPNASIRDGALEVLGKFNENNTFYRQVAALGKQYDFDLDTPMQDFNEDAMNALLYGTSDYPGYHNLDSDGLAGFQGIVNYIEEMAGEDSPAGLQSWARSFMDSVPCPHCHGKRLKEESLCFLVDGKNIGEVADMNINVLHEWTRNLESKLTPAEKKVAHEVVREILSRTKFIIDVGVGYLSLNRSSKSLSGGEAQRIRLATQIGARLVNVLYILDEPSIGLHERDNSRLIHSLKTLRDLGNTVIVVEHDRNMILNADYIVDIGPGAGVHGGHVVAQGPRDVFLNQRTLTTDYLNRTRDIKIPIRRSAEKRQHLILRGATGNNLRNVTLDLPLGLFICITGVSGSGKSSLVNDTLHPLLNKHFFNAQRRPLPYESIEGMDNIDKVIEINQSPIGRTPRSNPATYVGFFDEIRSLFTELPSARIRGYKPGRFSFNVAGGRCENCKGAGVRTIEMNFLPDVYVNCEVCGGKRYNRETLEIRYKGKSIADVLDMTINEAVEFFNAYPKLSRKLQTLKDVGLGYITLGQPSTTLSGGEAQRIKLATELCKPDTGNTLFILDEPTTGLHFEDIRVLLLVLQKLVDKGNTVLVVEHNMDVIKTADYIIDMGPDGGVAGGEVIFEGTPEELAERTDSFTGKYLRLELEACKKAMRSAKKSFPAKEVPAEKATAAMDAPVATQSEQPKKKKALTNAANPANKRKSGRPKKNETE
ncbi:MAG: excinuclease ABC subunit UvrA [Bacteroidales bacterium]|nr:excinuclease ABC subunit UvrA [Bacteroidales bacterium]